MTEQLNENELIETYNEYLDRIPSGCEKLVNELKNENISIISTELSNLVEGISWMIKVKAYLTSKGYIVRLNEEKLNLLLNDINFSLESRDFYTVAEIIEYQLVEFFEETSKIFS